MPEQYPSVIKQGGMVSSDKKMNFMLTCGYTTDPQTLHFVSDPELNRLDYASEQVGQEAMIAFIQPEGIPVTKLIAPRIFGDKAVLQRVTKDGHMDTILTPITVDDKTNTIVLGNGNSLIYSKEPPFSKEEMLGPIEQMNNLCSQAIAKLNIIPGTNKSYEPTRDPIETKKMKLSVRNVFNFFKGAGLE